MAKRVEVNNINLLTIYINQCVRLKNRGKVNKLSKNKEYTDTVSVFNLCGRVHYIRCIVNIELGKVLFFSHNFITLGLSD